MGRLRLALVALLVVGATLVPLVLYASLVRETLDRDVVARSADERSAAARIAAASIDRELGDGGGNLMLLAASPAFTQALREGNRALLDRRLSDLLRDRPNSLGAILDPKGIVLSAPLARQLIGQDFSFRDYFSGAVASRSSPYVSEIFASATTGNPSVVAISFAVRENDALLGVLVLTLAPADLLDLLQPLRQVEGRDLLIVDKEGRVVAATDTTLKPLSPSGVSGTAVAQSNEEVAIAGRQRVVTTAPVGLARWTLYVVDDPAVVLRGERALISELRSGGATISLVALVAGGLVVLLYAITVRQRDQLHRSRAALEAVNQALEDASRHKSDFLSSMSHELRTPLNAIMGFSDLLQEQLAEALSDRQVRYLRNIREAGEHLLGLINDVLDLSKVEAGKVEIQPEQIGLMPLVEPVVAATRASAKIRGLTFDVDLAPDVVVSVDPSRVRQILYNLLSNAVKFTSPGGSVELAVAPTGADLEVEVRDTGIGIPADKRDRVFGAFERLHEGRSDAAGTGLGLALTKMLVELHGGTVGFDSEEGRGSIFRVRLPDVVVGGTAERLLIVEDDVRDAELIVALAAKVGFASEIVRSVADALSAIRRARPQAVVLDLRLPDGRGERVLEALRSDEVTRRVPVVVVTVEDDERSSRQLGADDHLTKPIDHARLDGWLRQVAQAAARTEVSLASAPGR